MIDLLLVALSGSGSYVCTSILIRLLRSAGVFDKPTSRSSHARPTVRGVGVAIAASWVVSAVVVSAMHGWPAPVLSVILLGIALCVIGFLDDVWHLSPGLRLALEVAISAACVAAGHLGVSKITFPGIPPTDTGILGTPISVICLVTAVNVFNFMDGIDGLAAGQTVVQGAALCAVALITHDTAVALLAACLAASAGGFIPYNWSPARCFMGDAGSYFCGGTLAGLLLLDVRGGASLPLAALPSIAFFLDSGSTLIRRLAHRKKPWIAHRDHHYQRMVLCGSSHAQVTTVYLTVAVLLGLLTVVLQRALGAAA